MSYIKLNLLDKEQTISGDVHGTFADAAIAALSSEPETVHELELAVARFWKPGDTRSGFSSLHQGEDYEPYDAGLVIIDLAGRLVMIDSTYSSPPAPIQEERCAPDESCSGQDVFLGTEEIETHSIDSDHVWPCAPEPPTYGIRYHNGNERTDIQLPYRLPNDWLFLNGYPEYKGIRSDRHAERARIEWFDPRSILFGRELCRFIAQEILSAPNLDAEDVFTQIHAKWLITVRDDLQTKSPREWLLARHALIDFDLHSRQLQWSFTGECPPPLLVTAHAYRYAGFGTHEIVLYYDLVRMLLEQCCKRMLAAKSFSVSDETERLDHLKNTWLEAPYEQQRKSPALIIDWERRRIPMAVSPTEAIVDEDCPICQAMAEDLETPMFWGLDTAHFDDRFEFSSFETREEWEEEQRRQEFFNREFDRKWKDREKAALVEC